MDVAIPAPVVAPDGTPDAGSPEPWLAATLSTIVPGMGEWYAGARGIGLLLFAAGAALVIAGGLFSFVPALNGAVGLILLACLVPLVAVSAWVAHRSARGRGSADFGERRRSQGDAWKAVFLSRLLPGLGQIYDRRLVAGSLLVMGALLAGAVKAPLQEVLLGACAAAACADAWMRARGRRETDRRMVWRVAVALGLAIGLGTLGIAEGRTWVIGAFRIPSASMQPTLEPGDRILVNRLARGRARLGEVVMVRFPDRPDQLFVKSVFALAGDVVEFRDDGAYRNGQQVIRILDARRYGAMGTPYRVPRGTVFLLGDNYLNSNDSRFFGPIPLDRVLGRAYKIYWPPARARML